MGPGTGGSFAYDSIAQGEFVSAPASVDIGQCVATAVQAQLSVTALPDAGWFAVSASNGNVSLHADSLTCSDSAATTFQIPDGMGFVDIGVLGLDGGSVQLNASGPYVLPALATIDVDGGLGCTAVTGAACTIGTDVCCDAAMTMLTACADPMDGGVVACQ